MIRIEQRDNRIAIYNTPYELKDILKQVHGYAWAPAIKAWTYPMALESFAQLIRLFPDAVVEEGLEDRFRSQALVVAAGNEAKHIDDGNDLPDPENFTRPLWHHQKRAFWFSWHRLMAVKGAMLALDMGTGKTKVAIDLMRNLNCGKVLIMCPKNVIRVWPKMFDQDAPYIFPVLACAKGTLAQRAGNAKKFLKVNGDRGVIIVNHEAWQNAFGQFIKDTEWDMLIVDECHRAKAPNGKFSKFLGMFRRHKQNTYVIGLTGTPAPHSPLDLYAQARFIDSTIFGTNYQSFKQHYAIYGGYQNHKLLGFRNEVEMKERFERMAIQVKKRDALDLPPVTHQDRIAELTVAERSIYSMLNSEMIAGLKGGTITAANALVKLLRLAQIVQGWVKDDEGKMLHVGETKEKMLRDVLTNDIPPGEAAVVFCRFHTDLDIVHRVCATIDTPRRSFELAGQCRKRPTGVDLLEDWDDCTDGADVLDPAEEEYDAPVIAVQSQAGGEGVDLTKANYCIYLSVDFSLGRYDQSMARVDRPGQTSPVTYIHLLARDTVDEKVYAALQDRRDIVEAILGNKARGATKEEVKELLAEALADTLSLFGG